MGFRFRKSVNAGPLRINFSKSGVGYSVGTKGYRVTKKATGGYRSTASLPGTGISYVKESGASNSKKQSHSSGSNEIINYSSHDGDGSQMDNNMKNTKKQKRRKTELLLCLLLGWAGGHKFYRKKTGMGILYLLTFGFFCIGWLGDLLFLSLRYFTKSPLTKIHKIMSYTLAFTFLFCFATCGNDTDADPVSVPTEPTAYSDPLDGTQSATDDTTPFVTEASETKAPTDAPTDSPPTEAPTESQPKEYTYILNTKTKKFHYSWCRGVSDMKSSNKSTFTGTRDEVITRGYKSCGICNP